MARAPARGLNDLGRLFNEIELYPFDIDAAGFKFRHIQDVVDDDQQHLARVHHGRGVEFRLFLIEIRLEQQRVHAENSVQWSANLVAHMGQELAFHQVRRLGRIARDGELACLARQSGLALPEIALQL